jgi:hypothetical protein
MNLPFGLEVTLAIVLTVVVWSVTKSHRQLKATCVMALMVIWYCWIPVAMHPDLPSGQEALSIVRCVAATMCGSILVVVCIRPFPERLRPDRGDPESVRSHLAFVRAATWVGIAVVVAYFVQMPAIPILAGVEERPWARQAATTSLPFFGTASLFLYDFLPLAWAGWIVVGRLSFGLMLFAFTVLAVTATGQKAPMIYQACMLLVLVASGRRRFPYVGFALLAVVLGVAVLALVYVHNFGTDALSPDSVDASVNGLLRRITSVPAEVIAGWVDCFPASHPFLGLDAPDMTLDQFVFRQLNPASTLEGSANGPFFLSLYARFGGMMPVFWAATSAVFLGMVCLDVAILSRPRPTAMVAAYPLICLGAAQLCITDLYSAAAPVALSVLSMFGLIFAIEMLRSAERPVMRRTRSSSSPVFVVLCLLVLAYVAQGRIRAMLGAFS